jgi:hypothetical protein
MAKFEEEFIRRTGHRFNLIMESLPSEESSAISMNALLDRVKRIGYKEVPEQLSVDVNALIKRKEVATALINGEQLHWKLPKGSFEVRKRRLLIKLHAMELTEEDLAALEKIAVMARNSVMRQEKEQNGCR